MRAATIENPKGQPGAPPTADEPLVGWKNIGRHLGVSARTAQRWEATLALPVRRMGMQQRPVVCAFRRELDEWRESFAESTEGHDVDRADDRGGEQPLAKAGAEAPVDDHPRSPRSRHLIPVFVLLTAAVALAVWLLVDRAPAPPRQSPVPPPVTEAASVGRTAR